MKGSKTKDETKEMEEEKLLSKCFASFSCPLMLTPSKKHSVAFYILQNVTQSCFSKITMC